MFCVAKAFTVRKAYSSSNYKYLQGRLVAQSVKHLTLDLSSGHDLTIVSSSPTLGSMLGIKKKKLKKRSIYKFAKAQKASEGTVHDCSLLNFHYKLRFLKVEK